MLLETVSNNGQSETEESRFQEVGQFVNFGSNFTHEEFMESLRFQDENRRDFLFSPNDGQFVGTKFMVYDNVYPLDVVSLITLAERFKVSGRHTVTRTGLQELSNDLGVFEQTANFFLHRINKPLRFRTLVDTGIAFPSREYTIVNNIDLISLVLETIGDITASSPVTERNYLQKQLMYCFVPIADLKLEFVTAEGVDEELQLGLEVRNSEILQNAIYIAFKVIRKSTNEGILLTSGIKHVYHRHIGAKTNVLLDSVRQQLIDMFSTEAIVDAVSVMEFIKELMVTPMDDLDALEEFVSLTGLNTNDQKLFMHLANIRENSSLYSRTLGAFYRLVSSSTSSRERIEEQERISGQLLQNPKFRQLVSHA